MSALAVCRLLSLSFEVARPSDHGATRAQLPAPPATGFNTHAHSIVRTAMFSLMLAAGPDVGDVESPPLAHVSHGARYLVEGIDQPGRRCWHGAEATKDGGARPRNASTCLLWCAIALGALVRGCPLTNVSPICHHGVSG